MEIVSVLLIIVTEVEEHASLVALGAIISLIIVVINDVNFAVFNVIGNVLEPLAVVRVSKDIVAMDTHHFFTHVDLVFNILEFTEVLISHHLQVKFTAVFFFLDCPIDVLGGKNFPEGSEMLLNFKSFRIHFDLGND